MLEDSNYIIKYYNSDVTFYTCDIYLDSVFLGLYPFSQLILNSTKSFVWFPSHTFLEGLINNLATYSYTSQHENFLKEIKINCA